MTHARWLKMRKSELTRTTTVGRGRPRKANSARRAPFAASVPKSSKRDLGRTEAGATPAHIRVFGVELGDDERAYIRKKLGMKLGKFASSIERVSVRVEDVNGPRGGVDHACQVKVVLSELPSVTYVAQDASTAPAIDRALTGSERAVRRALDRRRMKSVKGRRTAGSRSRASRA